jgi:plasmid stability protein
MPSGSYRNDDDMCCACIYADNMSAMIQIRNVPDPLHRRLKSRAALAGMSLSDYLLNHLRTMADQPTIEELRARLERLPPFTPSVPPAQAVRAERDRR